MKIVQTKIVRDKEPTLEEMQKFVGGLIELVPLENGDQLIVNEEGLIHQLPHNESASLLAGQIIVGNAMVLQGDAKLT